MADATNTAHVVVSSNESVAGTAAQPLPPTILGAAALPAGLVPGVYGVRVGQ